MTDRTSAKTVTPPPEPQADTLPGSVPPEPAALAVLAFGFQAMGMHRIYARTGKQNRGSWRLMERLGMRREAHLRQSQKVKGEWDDEFIYAMIVDEWQEKQQDQPPGPVV